MKIMSFNTQHCLNFVTREIDYEVMANAIKAMEADIVGLNEMFDGENGIYGKQTEKLSRLTGLENHFFAKAIDEDTSEYGNGFLSRYKIVKSEAILIPDPSPKSYTGYYETRVLLKAELENGYTVLVTHFGLNPDEQQNAVKTVLEHITDTKCILMGDFNVTPDNSVLLPIRERMKDTAELFDEPKASWESGNPTVKIDYIFVSRDVEVEYADIPSLVASDHLPHVATIK